VSGHLAALLGKGERWNRCLGFMSWFVIARTVLGELAFLPTRLPVHWRMRREKTPITQQQKLRCSTVGPKFCDAFEKIRERRAASGKVGGDAHE